VKGIHSKRINSSRAIVANFYGPYESTEQAYTVLKDWLKEHGKKSAGPAFELYVDDPIGADGQPKDPYQVLTRIVMPYH
jgi:effector-binding domain-containing protein